MKVLGKTDDGLIVQVTSLEAAHLLGKSYPGSEVRNLRPGDEIPVHEIFEILRSWRENRDKLSQAAQQMRALADIVEARQPEVQKMVEGEPEVAGD